MTRSEDVAAPVERELRAVGELLASSFPSRARHPIKTLDERAIARSTEDAEVRAALFRLIDVTPACRSLDDLARHLTGYLERVEERRPPLRAAMRVGETRAGRAALGAAAAAAVRHMAHRFIVAEAPEATVSLLRRMWREGIAASLDLLGEATVNRAEADRYAERCAAALDVLARAYEDVPQRPVLESDSSGPIPRANLSVKVSALTPMLRPSAPARGRDDAAARLRPLLRRADELGCHVHIDMESVDALETTLELVFDVLSELPDGPSVGLVVQAYLRDSPAMLERILELPGRSPPLVVRLVKGAYWEHEVAEARQRGWRPPVFERKADSDRNFEALTRRLLDARPAVRVAIASHNLRSIAHAIAWGRAAGAPDDDIEVQVLRGLGDELAHALAANGFRVRSYCPVGDLVSGMAYLVRRLLENTSNDSFLHESARGMPLEQLLAAP
jgi:proline dehydrogenase